MRLRHWLRSVSTPVKVISFGLLASSPAQASATLELNPDPGILIALIIGFFFLMLPMHFLIFRPLLDVFDARADRIEGATQKASSVSDQAEQLLGRYGESIQESRDLITQERKELVRSARIEEDQLTSAERLAAEETLTEARAALNASLDSIRAELRQNVRALGQDAAVRILGREIT